MKTRQFQVDAFARKVFEGNPAAVCPLESWPADDVLQSIAEENNLSETAFFVPTERGFHLRWFTPVREVALCGHATLASAHVIFEALGTTGDRIVFETLSGDLVVRRVGRELEMDFPSSPPAPCDVPGQLLEALGQEPREVLAADDYVVVYDDERVVRNLSPNMLMLSGIPLRGVCVTAPGADVDFVSRFFAPKYGIPEDPVTGSAHCELAPYWSRRLGKSRMHARQVSKRGGEVGCEVAGDRVLLRGGAVTFMEAVIDTGS